MSLVMSWLARSHRRPRPTSQGRQLLHPPSTLILGLACLFVFAGLAVVSNVLANKTTTWWTTAAFIGFALMAVPLIADYFLARHHFPTRGWPTASSPVLDVIFAGPICARYATRL